MAAIEVSYTEARERLAELWDRALADGAENSIGH